MTRGAAVLTVLAALALGAPPPAASQAAGPRLAVEGAAFRVVRDDGRPLAQDELAGVVLALGDGSGRRRTIRIDSATPDPRDRSGETMLYAMSEPDAASGEWRNICEPDAEGARLGFPLAGGFTPDGRYIAAPGKLLITCTGGAEGKCVRLGYRPWAKAPDGTPMAAAYNACVRLVRADYAGDGRGTTRNGQPIDIYDMFGVQMPANDPTYEFEAGFSAEGAVCVRHVRVKPNASLQGLAANAPRLAGHVGEACTEDAARAAGAILFVRSPP